MTATQGFSQRRERLRAGMDRPGHPRTRLPKGPDSPARLPWPPRLRDLDAARFLAALATRALPSALLNILALMTTLLTLGCDDGGQAVPVDFSRRMETRSEEPPQAVTYAYLPQYAHRVSFQRHHPLLEYLRQATGLPIRQVFPDTFDEHVKMVGRGKIDISFSNPFVYVRLNQLYGSGAFVKALEHPPGPAAAPGQPRPPARDGFRGQIIVRADNEAMVSLADCRGKRWIAVDPTSAGGYLYPLGLFKEHGLGLADFASVDFAPGPGGKQEKVILAVLAGKYDLGTIREGALEVVTGSADISALRVLAETRTYPGWVYSARAGLDPGVLEKIRQALLALDPANPEHARILGRADFAGLAQASDSDFDPVRELVRLLGPDIE